MDALSTSHPLSSLRSKPLLPNTNPASILLKSPHPPPPHSLLPFANLSTKSTSSVSAVLARSGPVAAKFAGTYHSSAATGYVAALLDIAVCDGAVGAVGRDVRRFARAVKGVLEDGEVGEGVKGEVVRRVAETGRFYGRLVVLVRMLVRKGKVGVVGEVMDEFGRLWGELCGDKRMVMVN